LKKYQSDHFLFCWRRPRPWFRRQSTKNVTSTVLIFSSFLSFLMDVMGGKITINLKELH